MNVAYPVVVVVTGAVVFISAAQLLFSLPPTQPIKNKKKQKDDKIDRSNRTLFDIQIVRCKRLSPPS